MADLCAIGNVEDFLQVTIAGDDDKESALARAITEATAAIRNYTRQYLELVSGEAVTLDVWEARERVMLPELPVISVASVVEDGDTLTAGSDEDYVLAQYGQLVRRGRRWKVGPQILVVTYTHGYADIPDDVVGVCTRVAARAYQAGLRAADTDGVPSVSSKSLGDFSVSYGDASGAEGTMGASAARMLLLSEKDILDRYRHKLA